MITKIRLPRDGAEYASFAFTPYPSTATSIQCQVPGDESWHNLDLTGGALPRLLLQGPDAPPGAGVVVSVDGPLRVRVIDQVEIVVRGAGHVVLVS